MCIRDSYKARAEAVRHAEVYRGSFAISVCPSENVESPTIVGAQAANELLNIIGIKASFVLTEYNDKIYISSKKTGVANDFTITGSNIDGASALYSLGIAYGGEKTTTGTYSSRCV